MEIRRNPDRKQWPALTKRPVKAINELIPTVQTMFKDIQNRGDPALQDYTQKFDKVELSAFTVSSKEMDEAGKSIADPLKKALKTAYKNIHKFHEAQGGASRKIKTAKGVNCWRESRAIENVGLYIPGGTAPLFSTVLMLGIPAQIAGCREIVLCSPPAENGEIHPAILFAAQLVGVTKIVKLGGIQAIGALTFGTETVPKVHKIFGPGNQYVMAAKQVAQNHGMAIDMPAGPSEVLVIADENANPGFVAADLLSQAEHGPDSQVVLVSNSGELVQKAHNELDKQLAILPRKAIARQALNHHKSIVFGSLKSCLEFSNAYAPEHLIMAFEKARNWVSNVKNAGSVFLGNYSCESAGDYASGTNHTLPTNGYAKAFSGVSLDSFVKKITFQELSEKGIQNLGPTIEKMAAAEQLHGHKNAISLRLKSLKNTL